MKGKIIYLKPLDVWMFRKPRPFTAGESTLARSLSLPPPNTISGALAFYLLNKGKGSENKDLDPEGALREITCKIFAYGWAIPMNGEWKRLYKAPQDSLSEIKEISGKFLELPKSKEVEKYKDITSKLERTWVSEDLLGEYLSGEEIWKEVVKGLEGNSDKAFLEDFFLEFEERPGLKVSGIKTAEEGMLYFASYLRPGKLQKNGIKEHYLWVLLGSSNEDLINEFKEGEVLKLGGKGKLAEIIKIEEVKLEENRQEELKEKELYLASYGEYADGGYYVNCPSWADKNLSFPSPLNYFGKYRKWEKSTGGEYLSSPGAVFKVLDNPGLKMVKVTLGGNEFVLVYDEGHYRPINVYFVKEVRESGK